VYINIYIYIIYIYIQTVSHNSKSNKQYVQRNRKQILLTMRCLISFVIIVRVLLSIYYYYVLLFIIILQGRMKIIRKFQRKLTYPNILLSGLTECSFTKLTLSATQITVLLTKISHKKYNQRIRVN